MDPSQVTDYVMNTLCRLCAEKSARLTHIFKNESLPLKIRKCLSIEINESDHLPLQVCEKCFFKLNESYILYETAHKADERLKKLWKILIEETITCISKLTNEKEVENNSMTNNCCLTNEVVHPQQSDSFVGQIMVLDKTYDDTSKSNENFLIIKNDDIIQQQVSQIEIQEVAVEKEINESNDKKQVTKIYQCQFCSCKLFTQASLSIHESAHSEEKPFLCDTCGKSFKHANNLRCHSRIHFTVRKKYICQICSKGFLTNFFLQEHMNDHTGETPYKCGVCKKEFREKVHLRQHKWSHSSEKFDCPFCGSKFNRKGNMNEHIKKYHKTVSAIKSIVKKKSGEKGKEPKMWKCSVCSTTFPNSTMLKNHLKSHPEQKQFFCTICGKKFHHSGSITYHKRTAHTGEKPFQCRYCNEKFSLRSVQIIHERKIHTFEQPYKCSVCSRLFNNSSSLRNHSFIHSKNKMFECDACGKKFSRSSNLLVHKKLHSDDRQFTCDQCNKSYIQKHDLIKHMKVHDPKSKPFFCKYCGNSFSRKKDSVKHAMCQFEYFKKNNSDFFSAEKMLDSVTNDLEKNGDFSVEEEHLILESVEGLTEEKITIGEFFEESETLNQNVSEVE